MGNGENYHINIYRVKVPVKFNDQADLLKKNGPVSESDFVGAISGEKITDVTPDLSNHIPQNAVSFELIPGVMAYQKDGGTVMWWKQKKWNFEFIGSSLSQNVLKQLATAWAESDVKVSETGKVIITEGNKLTFNFIWDKQGNRYTFKSAHTDFNEVINVLNSFSIEASHN